MDRPGLDLGRRTDLRRRVTGVTRAPRLLVAAIVLVCVAGLVALVAVKVPRLTGTNAVAPNDDVVTVGAGEGICQGVFVPGSTGAIELPIRGGGPHALELKLYTPDGRELVRAPQTSVRDGRARFEIARRAASTDGTVCLHGAADTPVTLRGAAVGSGLAKDGVAVPGTLSIEYLRPGSDSLAGMLGVVAGRIGLVRGAIGGPLRAVLIALALLVAAALAAVALAGRVTRAAPAVFAVAALNAIAFSLLTPALQIPDEPFHASYVQDLAVKGKAPKPHDPPAISQELTAVVDASRVNTINFNPAGLPVWDPDTAQALLARVDAAAGAQRSPGSHPNVREYPPLYYAALVPVYRVTHALGGSTLAALTWMRILSALLAGVTVLALLALLRELLPGRPGLAVAIALACAYQPVLVWISGGVNPDGALIAAATTLFWLFARAFRRGLTVRVAVGLGLTLAACFLLQPRGVGLAPGWGVGVVLALLRAPAEARVRLAAAATAALLGPLVVYEAINVGLWDRPLLPGGFSAAASGGQEAGRSVGGFVSYVWQYFLPPVGSMRDYFHVPWTVKDLWVQGWVGRFGWYDYRFPNVVSNAGLLFYGVIAIAALSVLVPRLRADRVARAVTIVYALLAAGMVLAIARVAYPVREGGNGVFEQARYLMPLVSLYALALALAATRLRSRAVAGATVFVGVCALHLYGALALTVGRYYL